MSNKAKYWFVFGLFVGFTFLKQLVFQFAVFHSFLVSALWNDPVVFWGFYLGKLLPALLLGSFVFLFRNTIWTIVVSFVIDLWSIANEVYYGANDLFLSIDSILMAGNLKGFQSSILTFLNGWMAVPLALTVVYILCLVLTHSIQLEKLPWRGAYCAVGLAVVLVFQIPICYPRYRFATTERNPLFYLEKFKFENDKEEKWFVFKTNFLPYNTYYNAVEVGGYQDYTKSYIYSHSILSYAGAMTFAYTMRQMSQPEPIAPEEIAPFMGTAADAVFVPQRNLILILVESFESWAIGATDQTGRSITPCWSQMVTEDHVRYFSHVRSQVKDGVSGDGQMTLNTGLLALSRGAACMRFTDNTYPNYAHYFPNSLIINAQSGNCWNQTEMKERYGYKEMVEPGMEADWTDQEVFTRLQKVDYPAPYIVMAKTISMHSPFNRIQTDYGFDLSEGMAQSDLLPHYVRCVHFTDSCFGAFWEKFKQSDAYTCTDVLITGDHTVFKSGLLEKFQNIEEGRKWGIQREENFVPCILYSPTLEGNVCSDQLIYQMDLYPTLLPLIGGGEKWKGFGVNVLDSTSLHNRPIEESDAYKLSNRLIRLNYFATIDN